MSVYIFVLTLYLFKGHLAQTILNGGRYILSPKLTQVETQTGNGRWEVESGKEMDEVDFSFLGTFPPRELVGAFGNDISCVLS